MCESRNKAVSIFVEKLLIYRIRWIDIPKFLRLYYRDSSLITLYFVFLEFIFQTSESDQYDNYIKGFSLNKVQNRIDKNINLNNGVRSMGM